MTCREYAKKIHVEVVGKLTKVESKVGKDVKVFIDEDGNEFWRTPEGIVYIDKEGGCI